MQPDRCLAASVAVVLAFVETSASASPPPCSNLRQVLHLSYLRAPDRPSVHVGAVFGGSSQPALVEVLEEGLGEGGAYSRVRVARPFPVEAWMRTDRLSLRLLDDHPLHAGFSALAAGGHVQLTQGPDGLLATLEHTSFHTCNESPRDPPPVPTRCDRLSDAMHEPLDWLLQGRGSRREHGAIGTTYLLRKPGPHAITGDDGVSVTVPLDEIDVLRFEKARARVTLDRNGIRYEGWLPRKALKPKPKRDGVGIGSLCLHLRPERDEPPRRESVQVRRFRAPRETPLLALPGGVVLGVVPAGTEPLFHDVGEPADSTADGLRWVSMQCPATSPCPVVARGWVAATALEPAADPVPTGITR